MKNNPAYLTIDDEKVPLRASLSAFAELEEVLGTPSLRDLSAVVANPSAAQLIAILTAFAKAAGVANASVRLSGAAVDLGEALSAVSQALRQTRQATGGTGS